MKAVIKRQDLPGLIVLAIIGVALTFLGSVKLKNALATNKWPVTKGTITSAEVSGAVKYYPSIKYAYTVDGVEYTSDRISNMNFNTKKRSVAEAVVNKYPLGSETKIYYNRSDPSASLLEPGINTGNILLLAFGILLLAIPVLCLLFMKIEINRSTEAA